MQMVLDLDGQPVTMEVDTGAAVSIMSEKMFRSWFLKKVLQQTRVVLKTYMYTHKKLLVLGEV